MPESRYCAHCGAQVAAHDAFCGECGRQVSRPAATGANTPQYASTQAPSEPLQGTPTPQPSYIDPAAGSRPQSFDVGKLDQTALVLGIVGLVAFIDSFLPWYKVSLNVPVVGTTASASTNGWSTGIGSWLPILILMAVAVLVMLPAFGVQVNVRGGYLLYAMAAAAATVIILIRWATYPSAGVGYSAYVSAGAAIGTFVGLGAAVVATLFAYLGFVRGGGSLHKINEAFAKNKRH